MLSHLGLARATWAAVGSKPFWPEAAAASAPGRCCCLSQQSVRSTSWRLNAQRLAFPPSTALSLFFAALFSL